MDPRQQRLFDENWAPIVKVGDWLGSLLILALVPIALSIIAALVGQLLGTGVLSTILNVVALLSGLILTFYFAFGKRFNPSKRNFFKAYLILLVIAIIVCIVLVVVFAQALVFNPGSLTQITDLLDSLPY